MVSMNDYKSINYNLVTADDGTKFLMDKGQTSQPLHYVDVNQEWMTEDYIKFWDIIDDCENQISILKQDLEDMVNKNIQLVEDNNLLSEKTVPFDNMCGILGDIATNIRTNTEVSIRMEQHFRSMVDLKGRHTNTIASIPSAISSLGEYLSRGRHEFR